MNRPVTCPECGEDVAYEPPHDAEPEVNSGEWGGGYRCQCGWTDEGLRSRQREEVRNELLEDARRGTP